MAALGLQTLKVGTFDRHLLKRSQRKAKARRSVIAGLTLTSMVDMFSLLAIFLLQCFSTSPEASISKDVRLPIASTAQAFADAPALSLSTKGVYLDQKLLGSPEDVIREPASLAQKLQDLRELWERTHPGAKFQGRLVLQADRDLSSSLVSRFMAVLPSQAYSSVQLAAVSGVSPGQFSGQLSGQMPRTAR